ncbi:MAG TPA: beta-galactosidase GalA [Candidatus Acidoferrum sp.]|nr:beta-galactosidase GalA [Candidatus Acidoferrum sp.]
MIPFTPARSRWLAALLALALNASAAGTNSPRERLSLDANWKFHLGNDWGMAQNLAKAGTGSGPASKSFSDASWRTVNLPHDWAVELPFDPAADGGHGFKALGPGFPSNSVAWYRRTFDVPAADAGGRLWLEFDGVFRDATVFVNGWFVGHHEGGYNSFRYDITDVVRPGEKNVVAVKVDASQFEGWFYEGAGIYRHVWLEKTAPVAIAPDGIFVYCQFLNGKPEGPVMIKVECPLIVLDKTTAEAATAPPQVNNEIFDPAGHSVAKGNSELRMIDPPELWSPESPKLYKLVTTVEVDGQVVDRKETAFGIRTVAFDKDKGFLLNGKPYVLKGTCNHQDHAGVGAALPDALQYFRVAKLKEMGGNAIRTSHNPPTPELLDACDRLGMLVMDENRLLGSDLQNLRRWESQLRRDRNHPSVAIWSLCNEEFSVQRTPTGGRVAETMQNLAHQLDPTRPVTCNADMGNEFTGVNQVIEVRGWSYHIGTNSMDAYHAAHPQQPNVGSEQGSTVSTRGIYTNDPARGYVSAYDVGATKWSNTAEDWWRFFAARPWLSGGFVWTGFDYRGEPTPYSWPCINSHFGILDTCGFPKDNYWYYQAWWTDKPVLHLLPHWNWPGREGQDIDVWCYANCQEVELFLNRQSLGRKKMEPNSHLEWPVKYAPGILSAKGYTDGQLVSETKVETTGAPAAVKLTPDRAALNADGADVSAVTVAVTDAQGRIVPGANHPIHFELDGPGKIIGVGNGDPSCHEPDVFLPRCSGHSTPLNDGWRWKKLPEVNVPNQAELKTDFDDSTWAAADPGSDSGPLGAQEQAVFRRKLQVTEADLAQPVMELRCGMIDEEGWLYVNGQLVGESHDWQTPAVFNLRPFLHPGANTLAVAVANWNGAGGLNKGVTLEFQNQPIEPAWQRRVFNGLAQVLVQSSRKPGDLRLTARADGLAPATVSLPSQPCAPPPALP